MAPGKKMIGGKKTPPLPPSVPPDLVAPPCLPPTSRTTQPQKKALASSEEIPELQEMDLCKKRALNIMRNNQFAHHLGVRRIAQIFKSSLKKRTAGNSFDKRSKALLLGEDLGNNILPPGDCVKAGTARRSKRVLAHENLEETMRCTRQRAARQQASTTSHMQATEAGIDPDLSANQNQCETNNTEQGNLTLSLEVESMGLDTTEQGTLTCTRQVGPRGKSMGRGIDSISRGLGTMIPIIIKEGKRRPEAPMQAAKLASESGIIIRQHIPIYPNWTEYKKDAHQLKNLKGKLKGKFAIDIDSDPVTAACEDMLKGGTRQMRYRLKKKYFDGVAANQVRTTAPLKSMTDEHWRNLVAVWSSPEHKEKCAKNQLNRGKVRFQQRTGSRCYIAQAYVAKQEKYKGTEPTAIDLFEEMHCSKTKGFSEPVKKALDDMHAQAALNSTTVEDGQQAKTSIQVVSKVLPKSNTFLRNVGIQQPAAKTTNAEMKELQAELSAEKQENAELREVVESFKAKTQESDAKMDKQAEEIESLKKMVADTEFFSKNDIIWTGSDQSSLSLLVSSGIWWLDLEVDGCYCWRSCVSVV